MTWRPIRKVLVIKLGALGDFVLALAAMRRIRQAHPQAQITLLTIPAFETLAKASPYFDRVEIDGRPKGVGEWLRLIRRLRTERFDRVYDLQTSSRSSALFQMLRPSPPAWSGIAKGCALPHANPRRNFMHTLERQADQLREAGAWPDAPTTPGAAPPPDLSWIVHAAPEQPAGEVSSRPYVLLVPGGSAHRPQKRWPIEHFAELAALLSERGFDIVVIGGPQESPLARAIQDKAQAQDLTGRTDFAQVALLGARASLAIGNDTGPIHLIAAAGAPTVALFSSDSDPALCAPRGRVAMLRSPALKDLPVREVERAALGLLGDAAP